MNIIKLENILGEKMAEYNQEYSPESTYAIYPTHINIWVHPEKGSDLAVYIKIDATNNTLVKVGYHHYQQTKTGIDISKEEFIRLLEPILLKKEVDKLINL